MNELEIFYKSWCCENKRAFMSLMAIDADEEMEALFDKSDINKQNCKRLKLVKYLMSHIKVCNETEALEFALTRANDRLSSISRLSTSFLAELVDL